MIQKFEDDVQRAAEQVVAELREIGPCDFVRHVAARLLLKIICDMMGIGDAHYAMVLRNSNTILSGFDTELVSEDMDEALGRIFAAAEELRALVSDLAATRAGRPADDLVSALVNANIDGEQLTGPELASFFILLVVAGNETTRNAISHALWLQTAPRLRRPRTALLPRCAPGPTGDHGDAARAVPQRARHPRRRRAGPAAVRLHQRHQADAVRVQRGAVSPDGSGGWDEEGSSGQRVDRAGEREVVSGEAAGEWVDSVSVTLFHWSGQPCRLRHSVKCPPSRPWTPISRA